MNHDAFLGRGWRFPPTFSEGGKSVALSAGETDIRESLRILFSTTAGERLMRPEYGGGLDRHVFDRMNANVITSLRSAIFDAVLHFETRITLEDVVVDTSQALNGCLRFTLYYRVAATNSRGNMVFPFYFTEGTNVPTR